MSQRLQRVDDGANCLIHLSRFPAHRIPIVSAASAAGRRPASRAQTWRAVAAANERSSANVFPGQAASVTAPPLLPWIEQSHDELIAAYGNSGGVIDGETVTRLMRRLFDQPL